MPPERGGTIPAWVDTVLSGCAIAAAAVLILCLYLLVASLAGGS